MAQFRTCVDEESGRREGVTTLPFVEYSPQAQAACRPRRRVLRGDSREAAASAAEGTRLTWTTPETLNT